MPNSTKFNTSFIPKQSAMQPRGGKGKKKRTSRMTSVGMRVLSVVGLIVFLGSILAAGGSYLYQLWLEQSIDEKSTALAEARESFDPQLIQELNRVDSRFQTAQKLLNQHVAFSEFFEVLEENTVENVQFESFSYQIESDTAVISMEGRAQSFNTVSVQADRFERADGIENPMFTDLALDEEGNVTFTFNGRVSSNLISYTNTVSTTSTATLTTEFEEEDVTETGTSTQSETQETSTTTPLDEEVQESNQQSSS